MKKNELERKLFQRVRSIVGIYLPAILLVFLFNLQPATISAQPVQTVDKQVKEAVLAEDWGKVAKLLDSVNPKTPSPVLRMIKGHADLALNRNNESLCLFISALSEDDLGKWEEWSQYFVKKNPNKAISHYFRGDALARMENWTEALLSFKLAMEISPKHSLTLNARGVASAAAGRWDEALVMFNETINASPTLIDAYANRGTLYIMRREGAEGAKSWFDRALKISPDFALALNGRGSAYVALGEWDKAKSDFERAQTFTTCLPIVVDNMLALQRARLEFVASKTDIMLAQANPGTETHAKLTTQKQTQASAFTRIDAVHLNRVRDMMPSESKRKEAHSRDMATATMENVWNPLLSTMTKVPIVGGAVQCLIDNNKAQAIRNRAFSKNVNETEKQVNRIAADYNTLKSGSGMPQQGGVSVDMRRAYIDKGDWPVVTWMGLGYYVRPVRDRVRGHDVVRTKKLGDR